MKPRIVTDGLDPLTRPVLDYLVSEYGIDPHHIKRIQLDSPVNDVQTITVTLLVQAGGPSPIRHVPLLRPPMREEQVLWRGDSREPLGIREPSTGEGPTGDGDAAHQPKTTCVYMIDFPGGKRPCGELIRKEQAVIDVSSPLDPHAIAPGLSQWIHASDDRLGTSAHPATPGY